MEPSNEALCGRAYGPITLVVVRAWQREAPFAALNEAALKPYLEQREVPLVALNRASTRLQ